MKTSLYDCATKKTVTFNAGQMLRDRVSSRNNWTVRICTAFVAGAAVLIVYFTH